MGNNGDGPHCFFNKKDTKYTKNTNILRENEIISNIRIYHTLYISKGLNRNIKEPVSELKH